MGLWCHCLSTNCHQRLTEYKCTTNLTSTSHSLALDSCDTFITSPLKRLNTPVQPFDVLSLSLSLTFRLGTLHDVVSNSGSFFVSSSRNRLGAQFDDVILKNRFLLTAVHPVMSESRLSRRSGSKLTENDCCLFSEHCLLPSGPANCLRSPFGTTVFHSHSHL